MTSTTADHRTVPLVNYLQLGEQPHLVVQRCESCSAEYFGRRNGCARCGGEAFVTAAVANRGELIAFSIVAVAAPGIDVPFVSAVVDCAGTTVRANLINVPADPEHVRLGMPVQLTTFSLGEDAEGVEAIGFGFEPTAFAPPLSRAE